MSTSKLSGYDATFFSELLAVEDRHFWFRSRNRTLSALFRQLTNDLPPRYRVLELGCGTGNVLRVLHNICQRGCVIGMDLFPEALEYARARTSCPLVQGDVRRSPFCVQFQIVGLFDVLEHLQDDVTVLRAIRDLLEPAGALVLTVPAHRSLWSYFDEASHHCRRYQATELADKLEQAGYQIEYLSGYMASLYPLLWVYRRFAGISNAADIGARALARKELRVVPILDAVLTALLTVEGRLVGRRVRLPFGTSLIAIARRPRGS